MKRNTSTTTPFSSVAWVVALMAVCALKWFGTGGLSAVSLARAGDPPAPSPAAPGDARVAEPTAADQAVAEKTIRELFKADYAKRDPAERVALAQRFLREAASESDPALRYVMLRDARDLAASAGEYRTAHVAIDRITIGFRVDPAIMQAEALATAARSATTPKALGEIVDGAMSAIDQAVRDDDYDMALKRLGPTAQVAAERAQDSDLLARIRQRIREVRAVQDEFAHYKEAGKTLVSNGADPHANLVAGRFLALVKGDWERGLPYLVKSGDPALVAVARQDQAGPTDPQEQAKLADAWLALADKQPPGQKTAALSRADHWYVLALPKLTGLVKLAAFKHMKDLPANIDYDQLAARITAGLDKTARCGGRDPDGTKELSKSPGLLVGFDYVLLKFEDRLIVKSLRPIFLTANGKEKGAAHANPRADWITIEARPGYAVGAIVTDGTDRFNGMKITFMAVHGTTLDPDSAYDTPWIGGHAAKKLDNLAGDGRPVVGIQVTSGEDVDTFGLVQAR